MERRRVGLNRKLGFNFIKGGYSFKTRDRLAYNLEITVWHEGNPYIISRAMSNITNVETDPNLLFGMNDLCPQLRAQVGFSSQEAQFSHHQVAPVYEQYFHDQTLWKPGLLNVAFQSPVI